jgi:aspartyl-tRNA(Asn)/glutamyl-tRNA(Gln) amidotransferase subunit C
MALTRHDVEKVSLLTRLKLSPQEIDALTVQLGQVLAYVEQLTELDTVNVPPMAHAVEVSNVFADDSLSESLPRTAALANAPHASDEFYLVPAVLGE